MSTSGKIKAFCVVKQGKKVVSKKTLVLTPAQFKEQITTEKKRARFKAGRLVRVRREGKLFQYYGEENRRAQAA
jgi:hypothetical protein